MLGRARVVWARLRDKVSERNPAGTPRYEVGPSSFPWTVSDDMLLTSRVSRDGRALSARVLELGRDEYASSRGCSMSAWEERDS